MDKDVVRMARRRDYHQLVRLRAEWLDAFWHTHPAPERWCPACAGVPWIEDEPALDQYVMGKKDKWAAVSCSQGGPTGYVLCRNDESKKELVIEKQTPRIAPAAQPREVGGSLLNFVLQQGAEQGLSKVRVFYHGFPDQVDPLVDVCRRAGLKGKIRVEMVSRELHIDPGPAELEFRSAEEMGLDEFYAAEALFREKSVDDTRQDCDISRRMWCVEPSKDWLAAYDGETLVGTLRMAVTREGVGVLDDIFVGKEYRRPAFGGQAPGRLWRRFGRCMLAQGLSRLAGRTDVIWLDTDEDNTPARGLYEGAGFSIHHRHGGMSAKLTSP
jgi:ribosomal protein S18 acetylase RimI-like enzyme